MKEILTQRRASNRLYERSVAVLIRAYLHERLTKGDCDRCAVGTLCADAIARNAELNMPPGYWALAFQGPDFWSVFADAPLEVDLRTWEEDWKGCRALIQATGYAPEELARIEHAFEEAADPYRGLLAVFEVLQAIHEAEELCETTP